ncbi:MAG TPA: response regulator transcription factor [Prolixibacteraceae bacterium]|nr:response regulator transcription factor [Prolixibacteraceae bacterium]
MQNAHILIVEDEQRLAGILQKQLQESGFTADVANDGYVGKRMIKQTDYNLVIMDINLPLLNGYELCKDIRKTNSKIPIIMLTALGTPDNKLIGFEAGADDYVLKPFDFRELLARINVFLKRSNVDKPQVRKLKIADFEMDLDKKTASRAGKKIELTSKEFALMETFLINKDKLLSREYIIEKVWDLDFETGTNIIDVYVNYLRKKIDRDFEPKIIHTKFGFGFYCSETEI